MSIAPSPGRIRPMAASIDSPAARPADVAPPAQSEPGAPLQLEGTPELLAELAEHSRRLEHALPEEIIRFAVERYFPRLTMATAFGPEGCVILYYLARIQPRTYVFNLDTGYQFAETLELRDRIASKYGIEVELRRPATTIAEYEAQHGGPLYRTNPDQCCFDRKVTVLRDSVRGMHAWMSGIRRDQSADRAAAPVVGWDRKFNLVKISPLANWTKKDIWKLITEEDIPYNPLHDQGYPSIGCWPCTRSVMFGEDERAGRWSGMAKTECGLHTLEAPAAETSEGANATPGSEG
ncbi:MAG: phosphoadenylyl-sulfate reductase [Planctomycetia bacterium]|nr:phosphoadenylyl-sulfate reductase [Planctomycetia bacterium]